MNLKRVGPALLLLNKGYGIYSIVHLCIVMNGINTTHQAHLVLLNWRRNNTLYAHLFKKKVIIPHSESAVQQCRVITSAVSINTPDAGVTLISTCGAMMEKKKKKKKEIHIENEWTWNRSLNVAMTLLVSHLWIHICDKQPPSYTAKPVKQQLYIESETYRRNHTKTYLIIIAVPSVSIVNFHIVLLATGSAASLYSVRLYPTLSLYLYQQHFSPLLYFRCANGIPDTLAKTGEDTALKNRTEKKKQSSITFWASTKREGEA